ncbi:hypothetical protein fugu_013872 [Takifugu bimaculatus]|uniref:C2H2-type domain-containing protein n=1 Tax=Takifugu bimaculatus TaxID=433685 RepID=A0A4Z2C1D2_9TELE|nr:hypothetical protein fugu_013872 [Takifugu bimaculatus]
MEPHWRSHFGRREHKEEKKKKKRRKQQERSAAESKISAKQVNSSEVQKVHQQTPDSYTQRHHDNHSDALQHRLIGQEEADKADSRSGQTRNNSLKNISKKKKKEEARHVALACSVCHRKFSTKLTLRRHMGIHQGDKPFTCPHCHYSSRLKASLLQHLRTHTVSRRRVWTFTLAAITLVKRFHANSATTPAPTASCC